MSVKALAGVVPFWFKPEHQPEEANSAAEFQLRGLTQPEYLEVIGDHFDEVRRKIKMSGVLYAVRAGLLNWKNVVDDKGAELKFSIRAVQRLPYDLIAEIGNHIIEVSQASEEDAKN